LAVSGCALQRPAPVPQVFDFGPGAIQQEAPSVGIVHLPPLEVSTPQSSPALNSTDLLYRLAYANAQQLKPYALARWSMPPAQLIGQRLRTQLAIHRAVLSRGDLTPAAAPRGVTPLPAATPLPTTVLTSTPSNRQGPLHHLRLELEEFSQLFDAPDTSSGVLRLRATLSQRSPGGEVLLGQRSFITRQVAPTADASGGVRALTAATDQVIQDIETWLMQVERADSAQ
jgi:cholesterol transport system auxiliary component